MRHIEASTLHDLPSRVAYLSSFLGFDPEVDGEALRSAKPLIAPLVPTILEKVYTKLLSFDITAKAFVPKDTDFAGETVENVQELTLQHPQIALRKDFLQNYLVKLISTSDFTPTSPFWLYLDRVGQLHTGQPGFKHREKRPQLRVEYMHCAALLGYVLDIILEAILGLDEEVLDKTNKKRVLRALNRVIWIQNDLFSRWYLSEGYSRQSKL